MTFAWYERRWDGRVDATASRVAERAAKTDEEAAATLDDEASAFEMCWADERIMVGRSVRKVSEEDDCWSSDLARQPSRDEPPHPKARRIGLCHLQAATI